MTEKELSKKSLVESKKEIQQVKMMELPKNSTLDTEGFRIGTDIDIVREQFLNELTPVEKDVLMVAKEILKKKKYPAEIGVERVEKMSPMVDKLYSKCIAKFENQKGYQKDTIFKAIQSLEEKKWIITGQRMTKEEILNNPIKKNILRFIDKYPGVHARDQKVAEELKITRNPFIKHIISLESFNLIRSAKLGSTLNYFPVNMPDVFDDLAVLFHNPIIVEIIKAYIKTQKVTLMELAEQVGVYHRAIQYHINFLIKKNVLIAISASEVNLEEGEKIDSRRKYYQVNFDLLLRYNRLFKIPPFSDWI